MPERLHPGVYVDEISSGNRPIEQVSTSTTAFVGETGRGIPATAHFLTSFDDFTRALGDHLPGPGGYMAAAVEAFFAAGGQRAFAVRVLPSDAQRGEGTPVRVRLGMGGLPAQTWAMQFNAKGAGEWSSAIRVRLSDSVLSPGMAFTAEVLRIEGGVPRVVETYPDLTMDPEDESYFHDQIDNASQYVEVEDLLQEDLNATTRTRFPLPERTAVLRAAPPSERTAGAFSYRVRDGAEIEFRTWNSATDADPVRQAVLFNAANLTASGVATTFGPDGFADLSSADLANVLDHFLTDAFRVVQPANPQSAPEVHAAAASRPYLFLAPNAATATNYNLTARTLALTGAGGAPVQIFAAAGLPAGVDAGAVTPAQLRGLVDDALPDGFEVEARGAGLVIRGPRAAASATLGLTVDGGAPTGVVRVFAVAGEGGDVNLAPDTAQITVSEIRHPFVSPVMRELGFAGRARGYAEDSPANPQSLPISTTITIAGGTDGNDPVTVSDFVGDATDNTGLHALDDQDINLVALPGQNTPDHISALLTYVDQRNDCFAIVDGPGSPERTFETHALDAKQFTDGLPNRSRNSALYYPWLQVPDPVGVGRNPTRYVPPSGHVAGIFARTDNTRGVWKAPAGIEAVVGGAIGLQAKLLDADQDILNPSSVDCLRQFPGTGIVVWGARTLSSDAEWRYVSVRRTGLFLKESIRRGLRWAVFEPNDVDLWSQIRSNITSFMMVLFRQGAFQGATPDEAFEVVCDRSTNPQEKVDAGIVTARVSWAPLKPAEFVVIEITQKTLVA
jgi:phage tail sheath protein FI